MTLLLSQYKTGIDSKGICNSYRREVSQTTSKAVFARARYSDSQLELETIGCFLALHETRFPPKEIEYPYVEHHVSVHRARSALEKAVNEAHGDRLNARPKDKVPLTPSFAERQRRWKEELAKELERKRVLSMVKAYEQAPPFVLSEYGRPDI
nr:hypothetical protein [Tanacetum cinerariifolium]